MPENVKGNKGGIQDGKRFEDNDGGNKVEEGDQSRSKDENSARAEDVVKENENVDNLYDEVGKKGGESDDQRKPSENGKESKKIKRDSSSDSSTNNECKSEEELTRATKKASAGLKRRKKNVEGSENEIERKRIVNRDKKKRRERKGSESDSTKDNLSESEFEEEKISKKAKKKGNNGSNSVKNRKRKRGDKHEKRHKKSRKKYDSESTSGSSSGSLKSSSDENDDNDNSDEDKSKVLKDPKFKKKLNELYDEFYEEIRKKKQRRRMSVIERENLNVDKSKSFFDKFGELGGLLCEKYEDFQNVECITKTVPQDILIVCMISFMKCSGEEELSHFVKNRKSEFLSMMKFRRLVESVTNESAWMLDLAGVLHRVIKDNKSFLDPDQGLRLTRTETIISSEDYFNLIYHHSKLRSVVMGFKYFLEEKKISKYWKNAKDRIVGFLASMLAHSPKSGKTESGVNNIATPIEVTDLMKRHLEFDPDMPLEFLKGQKYKNKEDSFIELDQDSNDEDELIQTIIGDVSKEDRADLEAEDDGSVDGSKSNHKAVKGRRASSYSSQNESRNGSRERSRYKGSDRERERRYESKRENSGSVGSSKTRRENSGSLGSSRTRYDRDSRENSGFLGSSRTRYDRDSRQFKKRRDVEYDEQRRRDEEIRRDGENYYRRMHQTHPQRYRSSYHDLSYNRYCDRCQRPGHYIRDCWYL